MAQPEASLRQAERATAAANAFVDEPQDDTALEELTYKNIDSEKRLSVKGNTNPSMGSSKASSKGNNAGKKALLKLNKHFNFSAFFRLVKVV